MNNKTAVIRVFLDPDMRNRFKSLAASRGKTMQKIIEFWIAREVERAERERGDKK